MRSIACLHLLACISLATAAPVDSLRVDNPLIAWWTFDETIGGACRDASGNGSGVTFTGPAIERSADGVFDGALSFAGRHILRCDGKPAFGALPKISFSAWVRPSSFDRYNEIFRKEDGDRRILFSFQENGRVLSLGLNLNGYVECDAKVDPAQLLDGLWHHCAATFDGKAMRVYLDGALAGSLERPGTVALGGNARGCIGSMDGSECFQGAMDDLRIYADALTADDVAQLYRNGLEAISRTAGPIQAALDEFYVPGKTFADTLAGSRRRLAEKGIRLDPRMVPLLTQRLRAGFPRECQEFRLWTGADPAAYLRAKGNEFHQHATGRLMELLLEYRPLTPAQWKKQTADDRRKWAEAEAIEKKWAALQARGEAAQFSPEWIDLMFEAGRRIEWRPYEREAVAPYMTPRTPDTRTLSPEEAHAVLERDWVFQAGQKPTPQRTNDEIRWARELARRIAGVDFSRELAELAALDQADPADGSRYLKVRQVKRRIMFKNPAICFDQLVFVDMPFPAGSEWDHETRHRLGYMAVPGARLLTLAGLGPEGRLTQLMPQPPLHGSFWRPDVSFDGQRIVFCFKPHNEKSFHLYEVNADGTGLRQLTDGPFDDLDPIYLPDGRILFTTTRGHTYVRCMPPTNAYVLARCDSDGRNIYLVSANNEPDYLPSMMHDGRVVYTRWEYTDKPLWRAQKLWTINPDGTQVTMLWGNQSVWPDVTKDARAIPGSQRIMFTGCGHHNWFAGCVGIIDPERGLNFPSGLTKVTADLAWPECGDGPENPIESPQYHPSGDFTAYYSPWPFSERDFLVSARRGGKFMLYLMDVDGNRELIHEGVNNILHAMPLAPRPTPPILNDRVAWPTAAERDQPKPGVIFSNNVYQGAPEELRAKARFLRILSIDHKSYTYWNRRPYISTGPVVSAVQSEGVKRVLGTVPIEPDGSVSFAAPAGVPLHFQLLDERQRALQTMRSFVNTMPGEYRGCLGCHESHSRAPAGDSRPPLALASSPRQITPPPWSDTTVSYPRYVRPVLDKYCVSCHGGDAEGRKALDLTFRRGSLDFDETYLHLIGRPTWGSPYKLPPNPPPGFGIADMIMVEGYGQTDPAAYRTPAPMSRLSYKSRLIDLCSSGKHYDVRLDDISLLRLICWVDAMCPYRGDEEVREEPDPVFQGVEWLSIRPRVRSAPRIVRPGPVE